MAGLVYEPDYRILHYEVSFAVDYMRSSVQINTLDPLERARALHMHARIRDELSRSEWN